MTDVFIVFGSKSDSAVFTPLIDALKRTGISYEFRVLSAHKTPKELDAALRDTNASVFVAGAGLSAALPGVLASKTIKPVIGIPCKGAFNGLDAFLSCAQMPPEVPVICTGIENASSASMLVNNYLHGLNEIVLLEKSGALEKKFVKKCADFMKENNVPFSIAKRPGKKDYHKVFIDFAKLGKKPLNSVSPVITVPLNEKTLEKDSMKFASSMQKGYCVGVNNYKNACIAALELVNLRGNHSDVLVEMRKKAEKKVLDANK